jgi:hypothetical protein
MSATLKTLKLSNANILMSFETEVIKSWSEIEVLSLCESSVASMHGGRTLYLPARSWCVLLKNNGAAVV